MKLLGSHLLLMLPKPHPTLQTLHNLQIYISMTRSFSALLQCFPCRNFASDGSRPYISCQSPLMEKVQSHSETCYCRPLCLRKARYDWCRYHRPSAMCSYPTAREQLTVCFCLLYLDLKSVQIYLSLPISITTTLRYCMIMVYSVFDLLTCVMNTGMNSGKETIQLFSDKGGILCG